MRLDMKAENLTVKINLDIKADLKISIASETKLFWGKVDQQTEVKKHMT